VVDALTGESVGDVARGAMNKITLNNRMRSQIRNALAMLDLRNPDKLKRLAAVNQLLDRPDAASAALIQSLLEQESDGQIREAMEIVIALGKLSSGDKTERLAAVELLDGNIHPAVC
jgi:urea transport system permease protein